MNYENEMKLKNAMAYKKQINDLENATTENIEKLDNKIDVELKDVFKNDIALQKTIKDLTENQKDWQFDHYGEIEAWIRFNMPKYDKLKLLDELDRYLENSETYVRFDRDNECFNKDFDMFCVEFY